jgi:DNA invertase Pin-like site-specific DNA recombinase
MRVSRVEQTLDMQDDETMELIGRRGWKLLDTFIDHGISGMKERRPALDKMNLYLKRHRVDAVVTWKADRLFRSLKNMVVTLDDWSSMRIGFVSATEVFDSTTAQGKLLLHLTSAFAEFERSLIAERTKAGIAAARRRGAVLGRPRADVDDNELLKLRSSGKSVRDIAKVLGVGSSTVQRRLQQGHCAALHDAVDHDLGL